MTKLTIAILLKKNKVNLDNTLKSLLDFNADIVIGYIGKNDLLVKKAKALGITAIEVPIHDHFAQAKNYLLEQIQTDWILFLEPWEKFVHGQALITEKIQHSANSYYVNILQGDIITKQIRLWHRSKNLCFINPIYETVVDEKAENLAIYISSNNPAETDLSLVQQWVQKKPLATEPIYYLACTYLLEKKWALFLQAANQYLFQETKPQMSLIMIKYHCALILCYIYNDYNAALQHIVYCLAEKPLMAEFWCLLGDIYLSIKQYNKAIIFYENAMLLGGRRLKTDAWPFEISKYKEYPAKMISQCNKMLPEIKKYVGLLK